MRNVDLIYLDYFIKDEYTFDDEETERTKRDDRLSASLDKRKPVRYKIVKMSARNKEK